ncbi:MAG: hypothetical protein M1308_15375 [Actinobacteria bacterium]|nr:hypothetical protein [Actinomycetota bacterium]
MRLTPNYPHTKKTYDGFIITYRDFTQWITKRPFTNVIKLKEWIKTNIDDLGKSWKPNEAYWFFKRGKFFEKTYKDCMENMKGFMGNTVFWHIPCTIGLDVTVELASMNFFSELCADFQQVAAEWLEALFQHELRRVRYTAERYSDLSPMVLIICDDIYPTGGYILASCTEIHPAVKPENAITMILFGREYSRASLFKPRDVEEV